MNERLIHLVLVEELVGVEPAIDGARINEGAVGLIDDDGRGFGLFYQDVSNIIFAILWSFVLFVQ